PPVHTGEDPPLSLLCQSRGRMTHTWLCQVPLDELEDSAVLSPPVTHAILAHLEALEGQFGHYFSEADSWRRDKTWILFPFTDNAADGTRLTVTEEDQLIELSTD
ncbi:hypothetical protein KUCAC02_009189, partial [Chaenocephalus aceratus]